MRGRLAQLSRQLLALQQPFHSAARLATEAIVESAPVQPYPFSKAVRVVENRAKSQGPLMHFIDQHLLATTDHPLAAEHVAHFKRRSKTAITPGSVLAVSYYSNPTRTNTNLFSGVLTAIRRRGVDTSFVLRAMAAKTGVEVRFNAASNMIKEIKILARADMRKGDKQTVGRLLRARRAKLYYFRDQPHRMPKIANRG